MAISFVDRFKIARVMAAERTYEILGKLGTLVEISTDTASPALDLPLFGRFLGLGLQIALIVSVSQRLLFAEPESVVDLGNEHRVAPEVLAVHNASANDRAGLPAEVRYSVGSDGQHDIGKLVNISAGLHSEVLYRIEGTGLIKYRKRENAAVLEQIAGIVRIDAADRDAGRVGSYLHAGVRDACVGLVTVFRRKQENAVGNAVKRLIVHVNTSSDRF